MSQSSTSRGLPITAGVLQASQTKDSQTALVTAQCHPGIDSHNPTDTFSGGGNLRRNGSAEVKEKQCVNLEASTLTANICSGVIDLGKPIGGAITLTTL